MTPIRLQWLWFKQWPLWLVAPNSTAFYDAKIKYGKAVLAWLDSKKSKP